MGRPITVFCIRNAVDVNQGLTAPDGSAVPEKLAPALVPFTRPQFREVVGACVAVHPSSPVLGQQALWLVSFEWPTTPARQRAIRQKLREARDTDGQIWLQRATVPETEVSVTEYDPGDSPEDPPVSVVRQRSLRFLAQRYRMAGIEDDNPAVIEES